MEEEFELPVVYKGQGLMLKASLSVIGYTHKFMVEVDGQVIVFEPDEERNYRAVLNYDDIANRKDVDIELLKSISAAIAAVGECDHNSFFTNVFTNDSKNYSVRQNFKKE